MTTDRQRGDAHELFLELEPPPGGPERLRRRLDQASRIGPAQRRRAQVTHARPWPVAAAISLAIAAAAAFVVAVRLTQSGVERGREPDEDSERMAAVYEAPQFDRLLGRPLEPTELAVTLNEQTAMVSELESANDKVRIYRIE